MKAAFIFIFSLMILPFLISSAGKDPTKNVWGKVIDEVTENPLYGVNISIIDLVNPLGTITNEKGEFRLWNIPEIITSLSVSLNGYKTTEINIEQHNDSAGVRLVIKLQPLIDPVKQTLSHFKKQRKD
ncbi:MAG: carboxypeptidase-like regulatory domain-containing protein [Mangrovibacterium sp.]